MHSNDEEIWQLYDEQGAALAGAGANKHDIYGKGLLHGAAHVWIWRRTVSGVEILLQKRAAGKRTWPNLLDISAAGHIDLGEQPITAAIRETNEELGLKVKDGDLNLMSINRSNMTSPNGSIENEYCWIYILELASNIKLAFEKEEIKAIKWTKLDEFKKEVLNKNQSIYVPHGVAYFRKVVEAIEVASSTNS